MGPNSACHTPPPRPATPFCPHCGSGQPQRGARGPGLWKGPSTLSCLSCQPRPAGFWKVMHLMITTFASSPWGYLIWQLFFPPPTAINEDRLLLSRLRAFEYRTESILYMGEVAFLVSTGTRLRLMTGPSFSGFLLLGRSYMVLLPR